MSLVREKMTRKVAYVLESDDLVGAHAAMKVLGVHHVPVTRDGVVVGILSDRDILIHSHKRGELLLVPERLRVKDVMTSPVVTCREGTTIRETANLLLEHQIHSLPVVDSEGFLLGIITSSDLIRLLSDKGGKAVDEPLPFLYEQPSPLAIMFD